MKTLQERDDFDLLELLCQLRHRASIFPDNMKMYDNYLEARKELELRMTQKTMPTLEEIITHIKSLESEPALDLEYGYTTGRSDGFLLGAKWMRDKMSKNNQP